MQMNKRLATRDKAAKGFLNLLKDARAVILQDAAVLMGTRESHFMFTHHFFHSQQFIDMQAEVTAVEAAEPLLPDPNNMGKVIQNISHAMIAHCHCHDKYFILLWVI